jgi:hypothetical protein
LVCVVCAGAGAVVVVEDAAQKRFQGPLFVRRERLQESLLRPPLCLLQVAEEGPAGVGDGDLVATSVGWVGEARDEAVVLEVVEVADEMALVVVKRVGKLLLGERTKVVQGGQDAVVDEP